MNKYAIFSNGVDEIIETLTVLKDNGIILDHVEMVKFDDVIRHNLSWLGEWYNVIFYTTEEKFNKIINDIHTLEKLSL